MNQQEREQLAGFLDQLTRAQAGAKDGEAESLIREAVARQPDAAYLLVQRALLLDHAVQNCQTEINRLQQEVSQLRGQGAKTQGGFLDNNAWGATPTNVARTPLAAAAPATYTAVPSAPAAAPASAWGGGSFLGTMAGTAAGVVAGSFLFQGISHLMGSNHSNGLFGGGQDSLSGLSNSAPNGAGTVINNYYEGDASGSNSLVDATYDGSDGTDDGTDNSADWV
jgi:hypothetical protein